MSLVQIRHTYAADCGAFRLAVERDNAGWQANVTDRAAGRTVYSAGRSNLGAAKLAATEFALCSRAAAEMPRADAVARQLDWRESWF